MLGYYGGSYPLAIAAYNAGPGNVNKWIAQNGDPRLPGVYVLRWIESIPYYETKSYVQRVLENAVVYDLISPGRPEQHRKRPSVGIWAKISRADVHPLFSLFSEEIGRAE